MNSNIWTYWPFFPPSEPVDVPYDTAGNGNSCNPPGDGGGCVYCYPGQMGGLPDPGTSTNYCGGLIVPGGGAPTPVCPS